ncbi:uncharacterized protein Dana_GF14054 [Drosophila ananassae]|uniref:Uncharacterized protein n=1 Tax=Drosophila ananassae TaxID=7217 RepID=B3MJY0_DROAN|nr:uncharacterized protein LOC6496882 [Drosophila ananassae]EDV32435.1 uncharacterized protein Dana_GF14054 [Drosophila ananassae]KAH8328056.1 hypothetical protein KR067_003564 [Drosophila pandora]
MSKASKGFARLINPGVILGPELGQKIAAFEAMNAERSELDGELARLRKKQEETEDSLAEALAEDELQCNLRQQPMTGPNEDELQEILRRHLSGIINKLTSRYERILYLDADIRKLKQTIEKEIAAANQESAAAAASM